MKTQEEKKAESQNQLVKFQKRTIWITILMLIAFIIFSGLLGTVSNSNWFRAILYVIMLTFAVILYIQNPVEWLNMKANYQELVKKIEDEKKYLSSIKADYIIIASCKINEIPASLRKTAKYLLSDPQRGPEEIIKMREEMIETMEIKLQVYQESPEQNFLQYLITMKWIKRPILIGK